MVNDGQNVKMGHPSLEIIFSTEDLVLGTNLRVFSISEKWSSGLFIL